MKLKICMLLTLTKLYCIEKNFYDCEKPLELLKFWEIFQELAEKNFEEEKEAYYKDRDQEKTRSYPSPYPHNLPALIIKKEKEADKLLESNSPTEKEQGSALLKCLKKVKQAYYEKYTAEKEKEKKEIKRFVERLGKK